MVTSSSFVIVFCLTVVSAADTAISQGSPDASVSGFSPPLDEDATSDPVTGPADTLSPVAGSPAITGSTSASTQDSGGTTPTTPTSSTEVPIVPVTVSSVFNTTAPAVTTSQASTIRQTTAEPVSQPTSVTSVSPATTSTFPSALTRDPIGTKFFLFTRFHSSSPYVLDQNSEDSLKGAFFTFCYNANNKRLPARDKKTYILIHGLADGFEVTNWMKTMKSRLLETDREANVVLVDWSRGAAVNLLNDLKFSSIRIVGQQIVQMIRGLQYLYPATFSPENVHIIAHSFGSFAADVVGRNIGGIGRITALDPAGGVSNLHNLPPSQRLDPTDAKFVDVIHTDAPRPADAPIPLNSGSSILPATIVIPGSNLLRAPAAAAAAAVASGTSHPLGHFDFYPNGGYTQPGCNVLASSPAASLLRPLLPAVTMGGSQSGNSLKKLLSCSHSRAIDLFIESIRPHDAPGCDLIAYSCANYTAFLDAKCTLCKEGSEQSGESCARMGFHAVDSFNPHTFDGNKKFYLNTNSRAPFCLYHYGVAVKIAKKPRNSARGGVLIASLEGEYVSSATESNLEVKLLGGMSGFKSGKTVRAMFTHYADCGAIKSAVVSWIPAPPNLSHLLSPSSSPSLYVQALRVYPMSFAEVSARKAIARTLCPPVPPLSGFLGESLSSRGDPPAAALSAFFKEVEFSASRCTHHNQQHRVREADVVPADAGASDDESIEE